MAEIEMETKAAPFDNPDGNPAESEPKLAAAKGGFGESKKAAEMYTYFVTPNFYPNDV